MEIRLETRALLLILASATALLGQAGGREIVRRAVAADERNWKLAQNYTFSERVNLRYLDAQGGVKFQEETIHDVILLDGSPYRRLVAREARPLPPAEELKEKEKLARSIAERREETVAQRSRRLADYDQRPEWQREARRELLNAFDFRLAAEEVCDGHGVYVIEATPRQGYQPRSRTAKMLAHIRGKLWVDREDYHLVRAEVEAVDTITVGLFLIRVAKGASAAFDQTFVNNEVWLPRHVWEFASARLGLLKVVRVEQEISYSKCCEVEADSPIVSRMAAK